jgi:hypothetical protein
MTYTTAEQITRLFMLEYITFLDEKTSRKIITKAKDYFVEEVLRFLEGFTRF